MCLASFSAAACNLHLPGSNDDVTQAQLRRWRVWNHYLELCSRLLARETPIHIIKVHIVQGTQSRIMISHGSTEHIHVRFGSPSI